MQNERKEECICLWGKAWNAGKGVKHVQDRKALRLQRIDHNVYHTIWGLHFLGKWRDARQTHFAWLAGIIPRRYSSKQRPKDLQQIWCSPQYDSQKSRGRHCRALPTLPPKKKVMKEEKIVLPSGRLSRSFSHSSLAFSKNCSFAPSSILCSEHSRRDTLLFDRSSISRSFMSWTACFKKLKKNSLGEYSRRFRRSASRESCRAKQFGYYFCWKREWTFFTSGLIAE